MITFITGGSVIAIILIQLIKKLINKYIGEDYQSITTQITLLVVSVILATIGAMAKLLPPEVLSIGGAIFAESILIYDIIYKSIYKEAIRGEK